MYDFVPYGDNWAVPISGIIQLEQDKSNAADVMEFAQPAMYDELVGNLESWGEESANSIPRKFIEAYVDTILEPGGFAVRRIGNQLTCTKDDPRLSVDEVRTLVEAYSESNEFVHYVLGWFIPVLKVTRGCEKRSRWTKRNKSFKEVEGLESLIARTNSIIPGGLDDEARKRLVNDTPRGVVLVEHLDGSFTFRLEPNIVSAEKAKELILNSNIL